LWTKQVVASLRMDGYSFRKNTVMLGRPKFDGLRDRVNAFLVGLHYSKFKFSVDKLIFLNIIIFCVFKRLNRS
jgi:hypothetical protein